MNLSAEKLDVEDLLQLVLSLLRLVVIVRVNFGHQHREHILEALVRFEQASVADLAAALGTIATLLQMLVDAFEAKFMQASPDCCRFCKKIVAYSAPQDVLKVFDSDGLADSLIFFG